MATSSSMEMAAIPHVSTRFRFLAPSLAPFFVGGNRCAAVALSSAAGRERRSRGGMVVIKSLAPCARAKDEENVELIASDAGTLRRTGFDINLAVVLAGFAFESYTSPPEDVGWCEFDEVECRAVFLSEKFLREMYDGQMFVKLKKGTNLPGLDLWGTSDPYVVLKLDGRVVKSTIKWATKDPLWNEEFTFNVKLSRVKLLQVAAWDANLVTAHKFMGEGAVDLETLCDGNWHDVVVNLEGIETDGKIHMEVRYKSYDEIEQDKKWWRIPFVSDFFVKSSLGSALKFVIGSESINASQFVKATFGQINSFAFAYLKKPDPCEEYKTESKGSDDYVHRPPESEEIQLMKLKAQNSEGISDDDKKLEPAFSGDSNGGAFPERKDNLAPPSEDYYWKEFSQIIYEKVVQILGFSIPEMKMFNASDLLNSLNQRSRAAAEKEYVDAGLASPETSEGREDDNLPSTGREFLPSLADIKRISLDVLSQTEILFGALMVLSSQFSSQESSPVQPADDKKYLIENSQVDNLSTVKSIDVDAEMATDAEQAEEMRRLFSSAESAMEAWAMLATSLGRNSFIKSDFQKICFLDNISTDTQVAIWRDDLRKRLVVAFRGTEQSKWKDLVTDIMIIPAGLDPDRFGVETSEEVQVHSGFLNAYDSVRNKIMTIVRCAIGYIDGNPLSMNKWHVYITGHSLGGALATLLVLELSSTQMARNGMIKVTMYNFGSPRVGNKSFADLYNTKVKDSWRVVNHRDIIPSVPRLMGYYHVNQPVYLTFRDLQGASQINVQITDGYQGDVIGESTPDILVSEFLKGERQLVEKILQTEINLLQSISDGSALMQHMEDFYYVTLLQSVRSSYQDTDNPIE